MNDPITFCTILCSQAEERYLHPNRGRANKKGLYLRRGVPPDAFRTAPMPYVTGSAGLAGAPFCR